MKDDKLEWMQVLRGIASIMVVMMHFFAFLNVNQSKDFFFNDTVNPVIYYLFSNGYAGVDIFFFISGFIMFYVIKNYSSYDFLMKRLIRIYPLFLIVILVSIVFKFDFAITKPLWYTVKQFLFIPTGGIQPFLGSGYVMQSWTLTYEMYFYFTLAMSLFFGRYWFRFINIYFLITLIILPLVCFNRLTLLTSGYDTSFLLLQLISQPMIFEFWLGLILGYLFINKSLIVSKSKYCFILFLYLLFFISMYLFFKPFHLYHQNGLVGVGGLCFFLIAILLVGEKNDYLPSPPKFLLWLGDRSYSIYLWHAFIIEFVYFIYLKNPQHYSFIVNDSCYYYRGFPNLFVFIIFITLTLIVSNYSYKYIEMGISKVLKKRLLKKL